MKANEAPIKIYLQVCGDCQDNECDTCKFEDLEDNITWCKDKIFDKDVEYTRTDAFIEKSVAWLKEHKEAVETEDNGIMGWIPDYFIEDFRKYMKGE
jgi:hypothetical protein